MSELQFRQPSLTPQEKERLGLTLSPEDYQVLLRDPNSVVFQVNLILPIKEGEAFAQQWAEKLCQVEIERRAAEREENDAEFAAERERALAAQEVYQPIFIESVAYIASVKTVADGMLQVMDELHKAATIILSRAVENHADRMQQNQDLTANFSMQVANQLQLAGNQIAANINGQSLVLNVPQQTQIAGTDSLLKIIGMKDSQDPNSNSLISSLQLDALMGLAKHYTNMSLGPILALKLVRDMLRLDANQQALKSMGYLDKNGNVDPDMVPSHLIGRYARLFDKVIGQTAVEPLNQRIFQCMVKNNQNILGDLKQNMEQAQQDRKNLRQSTFTAAPKPAPGQARPLQEDDKQNHYQTPSPFKNPFDTKLKK